jgi:hypothetical protein
MNFIQITSAVHSYRFLLAEFFLATLYISHGHIPYSYYLDSRLLSLCLTALRQYVKLLFSVPFILILLQLHKLCIIIYCLHHVGQC